MWRRIAGGPSSYLGAVQTLGNRGNPHGGEETQGGRVEEEDAVVGEVYLRILIAYEKSHRLYGYALESAIKIHRPHLAVEIADEPEALEAEVERLNPHLMISNRLNTVDPGGRVAWLRLSHEPDEESDVCVDGETSRLANPGLEELLRIIDETEEMVWTGRDLEGC